MSLSIKFKTGSKKKLFAGTGLLMAGTILLCNICPVYNKKDDKAEEDVKVVTYNAPDYFAVNSDKVTSENNKTYDGEKSETVYVKAKEDGSVKEIKVNEYLKTSHTGESVEDFTILTDIKNKVGDEEYTLSENGTLIWENHGENITYEGKTDKELPVAVKITYYLDGKEISGEEIAGKTGEVKIRFDYENKTKQIVNVNGKDVESIVPFLMCTLINLPADIFSDVNVTNGKVMDSDEQYMVVGYSLPGLSESLHLKEYEPTEDIDLKEYIEVTAYANEFELDFTATIATSGLFDELDISDFDEMDDKLKDVDELEDNIDDMTEGVDELLDGVKEVRNAVFEYTDAINKVNDGIAKLADGAGALDNNSKALNDGAKALADGIAEINKGLNAFLLQQADADKQDMNIPETENQDSMAKLAGAAKKLSEDATALSEVLVSMGDLFVNIQGFAKKADEYQTTVNENITRIDELLNSIDMADLNQLAKEQARAAVISALAESGLSEEQIAQAGENVANNVDISEAVSVALDNVSSVRTVLYGMPALEIPEFSINTDTLSALITDMQAQLYIISEGAKYINSLTESLSSTKAALKGLKEGLAALETGSNQLTTGLSAYTEGVSAVNEGIGKLYEGTDALSSVGGEFNDGFNELVDGIQELRDGVWEFRDEGIDDLKKIAGDDLRNVLNGIRAGKLLNDSYNNYAGIKEGMKGSVLFIIETDAIEKE